MIPNRFPHAQIPDLVATHHDWIVRTRARILAAAPPSPPVLEIPPSIELPLTGEVWTIRSEPPVQRPTSPKPTTVKPPPGTQLRLFTPSPVVIIHHHPDDVDAGIRALHTWLRDRADHLLPPLLGQVAVDTGLNPKRVVIRSQRTRWASCSARGTVTLNFRLLLLPPDLLRHLFIHELAHLKQMNHSSRFWALVARFDPEWRGHRAELRAFERDLPAWARFG